MNPAQLLHHFDCISEAPDAIPRLRRFILDLAVRGKLVEQDPRDEPASELLTRIQDEKARLVSGGEIKKEKSLPAIEEDEIPFELPIGWAWERLGNVGDTNIGLTYSPQDISDVGIPVLRSSNIQNGKLHFSDLVRVRCEPKRSVMVRDGDLLICARNGSRGLVGKVAVIQDLKEPAAFGAFMAVLRSGVNQYLYHFICSPLFRQVIDEVNTTTINQITQNNLRSTLAPIPPLAEQHRIVAKVDELMALCDRLEAAKAERESRRDRLVASSLNQLSNGADADTFRDHARFYFNHLPRLTVRLEHIQQLRQTILNLAIRGKLVPQDSNDEPASKTLEKALLENSRKWRELSEKHGEKSGSTRGAKWDNRYGKLSVPNTQGLAQLPTSWEWVCWESILAFGEGTFKRGPFGSSLTKGIFVDSGYKVYEQYCPINDDCSFARYYITPQKFKELEGFAVKAGDFLISCSGVTLGRITQVPDEYEEGVINQALLRVRTDKELIQDSFFKMLFRSPYFQAQIFSNSTGMAIPNVKGVAELKAIPLPLPPLAEQQRIVAKVDELMALCDKLEAQLTITHTESRRLLEAVLHEALAT